jgi:hypothetical protein
VSQSIEFCIISLGVACQHVFIVVYFVIDSVWKLLATPSCVLLLAFIFPFLLFSDIFGQTSLAHRCHLSVSESFILRGEGSLLCQHTNPCEASLRVSTNSASVSSISDRISVVRIIQLTMCMEIINACSDNQTKTILAVYGRNVQLLHTKLGKW